MGTTVYPSFARISHPLVHLLQAVPEDIARSAHKSKQHSNHGSVPSSLLCQYHLLSIRKSLKFSPRIPVDLAFGLSREDPCMNHAEYTKKWKVVMKDVYELAKRKISKSADGGKKQCDRKVRFASLQPGDRVLVRNLSERGGPK